MGGRRWVPNRRWGLVMAGSVAVAIGGGLWVGNYLTPNCELEGCPDVERLESYRPPEPPKIFDADGELAGQLSGPRRIVISPDSIPDLLKEGYVAVEDRRFYDHGGVDLKGAFRAFFANLGSGGVEEGASTITMQLARNVFSEEVLDYNRWHRKASEIRISREIEAQLTKDQILSLYLNQIYLGDGVWGVETAARHYFGKPLGDLDLVQTALLIGLAKNPEGYNPRRNPERSRERIRVVLDVLAQQGIVPAQEAAAARDQELAVVTDPQTAEWGANAFFLSAVRRELRELYPNPTDRRGLRVYTGLDQKAQAAALEALDEQIAAVEAGRLGAYRHKRPGKTLDVAQGSSPYLQGMVVAMEPNTGLVTTLVGGRDYDHSEFDRAFQAKRQPGSAFKPIVYAAALSQGLRLSDDISTEPVRYAARGSDDWAPRDHVSGESLTVRDALVFSSNTAAVRVGERVGTGRVIRQARAMGISSDIPDYPSIYLGAAEVIPAELVAAYAVFGNGGRRIKPFLITRIEDANGQEAWRHMPEDGGQALDPRIAFLVLDMMRDVTTRGTGYRVGRSGLSFPAAGKTGTTNDSKDAWFVGVTPALAAGVWIGFDTPETVVPGGGGGDLAAPVWARFMQVANQGRGPSTAWSAPPGITQTQVDSKSGLLWGQFCQGSARQEFFLSGTEPVAECRPDNPYWYRTAGGDWSYDSAASSYRWPDRSSADSARIYAQDPERYRTRFYTGGDSGSSQRDARPSDDWEDRLREEREERLDSMEAVRRREANEDALRRNRGRIRPADTTAVPNAGRVPDLPPRDTVRGGGPPPPDTVPPPPPRDAPPPDTVRSPSPGAGSPPPPDTTGAAPGL